VLYENKKPLRKPNKPRESMQVPNWTDAQIQEAVKAFREQQQK
jgi:hypothetical protein